MNKDKEKNKRAIELANLDFENNTDDERKAAMKEMIDCVDSCLLIAQINFMDDGPGMCVMNQGAGVSLRMAAVKAITDSVREDMENSPLGLLKALVKLNKDGNAGAPQDDFLKELATQFAVDPNEDEDDPFEFKHPHFE